MGSFQFTAGKISTWKSTGIFNYLGNSNMNAVGDSKSVLPELKNDGRMSVSLGGNRFQQNKVIIPNNDNVINIYCVYKIDPIASTRDDTFTVQNALFGAMEITKNVFIFQNIIIKGMVFVLMKTELLVKEILTTGKTYYFLVFTNLL